MRFIGRDRWPYQLDGVLTFLVVPPSLQGLLDSAAGGLLRSKYEATTTDGVESFEPHMDAIFCEEAANACWIC